MGLRVRTWLHRTSKQLQQRKGFKEQRVSSAFSEPSNLLLQPEFWPSEEGVAQPALPVWKTKPRHSGTDLHKALFLRLHLLREKWKRNWVEMLWMGGISKHHCNLNQQQSRDYTERFHQQLILLPPPVKSVTASSQAFSLLWSATRT